MKRELRSDEIIYDIDLSNVMLREEDDFSKEYNEAYQSIKTALEIENEGYNVYLFDEFTNDKLSEIKAFISKLLKGREKPKDICYVIDYDVKAPKALLLSNGYGNKLKIMVEKVQESYVNSAYEFYNTSTNKEKENIVNRLQKKRSELVTKLIDMSHEAGFELKPNNAGFGFMPTKDGEAMTEKEYEELDEQTKGDLLERIGKLKIVANDIIDELNILEERESIKLKKLLLQHLESGSDDLKANYKEDFVGNEDAIRFLDLICVQIENDIMSNYSANYEDDEEKIHDSIYKYAVNVVIDNSKNCEPQVIFEEDPAIYNLVGSIEYENHNGTYTTDVTLIKGGSILKANEGCLIIRANNLIANAASYYYFKKSILSGKVNFDYNKSYLDLLSLNGLKPEAIPIKEKVILIGDYELYNLLYNFDEDFKKVFKIRAEYNPVVKINQESKGMFLSKVMKICKNNNLNSISEEGLVKLSKYLSRKAEDRNKLFLNDEELNKVLIMANNKVVFESGNKIEGKQITDVVEKQELLEKEIFQNYEENKILIKTTGKEVGQVNGLSVMDGGYFSFGKPIRITCSCYKGCGNIVDVQKESELSGNIHKKSLNILRGYLSSILNVYESIPVDFHLSFEQVYGKIEGDSASVAQIISIISALSKIPVKQNIAVTGSINQFGEVQAVGGINEKIEGFFKVCKIMENTMDKGVIIPFANKDDIVLSEEIEAAVKSGEFHIYTITDVKDAVELLLGDNSITFEEVIRTIQKEMRKYIQRRR